ncbi:hypothetical protein CKAH01_03944 [Colletotrichum kahawae]|uniref:Uncharacterized protein n=1 Tax=Colletotrichum kahawae TaxID=34407 RepID=A0AAD9YN14_COLKA|nr:hypothetical protein CKAH01_03944 [Colletotrichum kahawae]
MFLEPTQPFQPVLWIVDGSRRLARQWRIVNVVCWLSGLVETSLILRPPLSTAQTSGSLQLFFFLFSRCRCRCHMQSTALQCTAGAFFRLPSSAHQTESHRRVSVAPGANPRKRSRPRQHKDRHAA